MYPRVLPRDLFNEADLLKCVGKLCLLIHDDVFPFLRFEHDGEAFDIQQNQADGSIYIANIRFFLLKFELEAFRPLNSRRSWVLYFREPNDEIWEIFDELGNLLFTKDVAELLLQNKVHL